MFENQSVLITGAANGIGYAAARQFAAMGARVFLNDLDADACAKSTQSIREDGNTAWSLPGNITESETPQSLIQQVIDQCGELNILVNNAGFTWDGMLHKMSDNQWQRIQDVHVTAPFRLIRALAQVWRPLAKKEAETDQPHPHRCIVNVSSTSGLHGNIGQINYASAKMAVIGMTKTVAREWGRFGIRCNAVAFGYIDTRLTRSTDEGHVLTIEGQSIALGIPPKVREASLSAIPLERAGTPEEAAAGILLMASPLASYITGHTLEVTGGLGI
ncbi:MAG: SDR family oxidoreductase [Bacteroidetes bacterium]|nr:SDR family oxidoreductase [Bacteroidota bacterium]MCY4204310.1 SDR family oxidoreductase [Bacteroidota bacterium]